VLASPAAAAAAAAAAVAVEVAAPSTSPPPPPQTVALGPAGPAAIEPVCHGSSGMAKRKERGWDLNATPYPPQQQQGPQQQQLQEEEQLAAASCTCAGPAAGSAAAAQLEAARLKSEEEAMQSMILTDAPPLPVAPPPLLPAALLLPSAASPPRRLVPSKTGEAQEQGRSCGSGNVTVGAHEQAHYEHAAEHHQSLATPARVAVEAAACASGAGASCMGPQHHGTGCAGGSSWFCSCWREVAVVPVQQQAQQQAQAQERAHHPLPRDGINSVNPPQQHQRGMSDLPASLRREIAQESAVALPNPFHMSRQLEVNTSMRRSVHAQDELFGGGGGWVRGWGCGEGGAGPVRAARASHAESSSSRKPH
jgi:hypothetical protein